MKQIVIQNSMAWSFCIVGENHLPSISLLFKMKKFVKFFQKFTIASPSERRPECATLWIVSTVRRVASAWNFGGECPEIGRHESRWPVVAMHDAHLSSCSRPAAERELWRRRARKHREAKRVVRIKSSPRSP